MTTIVLLVAAMISTEPAKDISAVLPLDANRLCILPPTGAALFDAIESAARTGSSTPIRDVRGRVTVSRRRLRHGVVEHVRRFRPEGVLLWQGLPVAFVHLRRVNVPESEGTVERGIGLTVPLGRLTEKLRAAGHPVARAPDTTPVVMEPFDGEAHVEVRDGAAFLACEQPI